MGVNDNHRNVYPLPRTGWLRGEQPVRWVGADELSVIYLHI